MKITPEQTDQLYDFTRRHYVEYYDLQTELVDHLANAIEEQWQQNSNIDFEEALDIEFKKFGIFGFTDLVANRQKTLSKKYYGLIWRYFVDFFKLPKVIGTLLAVYLVYIVLNRFQVSREDFSIVWLLLVGISFVHMLIRGLKRKRKLVRFEKIWLFKEIITNVGYVNILVLYVLRYVMGFLDFFIPDIFTYPQVQSVIVVTYLIFIYVVHFFIPLKAEEFLKQTYPEYEFSK